MAYSPSINDLDLRSLSSAPINWHDDVSTAEREVILADFTLGRYKRLEHHSLKVRHLYALGSDPAYPYVVKAADLNDVYASALFREFNVGSYLNNLNAKYFVKTLAITTFNGYVFLIQERAKGIDFVEWFNNVGRADRSKYNSIVALVLLHIRDYLSRDITHYHLRLYNVFVYEKDDTVTIQFTSYHRMHIPCVGMNEVFVTESQRQITHAPGLFDGAIDYQFFLARAYELIDNFESAAIIEKKTVIDIWPAPDSYLVSFIRDKELLPVSPNTGAISLLSLVKQYVSTITGLAMQERATDAINAEFRKLDLAEQTSRMWTRVLDNYASTNEEIQSSYYWQSAEAWNYTWYVVRRMYFDSADYTNLKNLVAQWLSILPEGIVV